jgi:hypothetical protein
MTFSTAHAGGLSTTVQRVPFRAKASGGKRWWYDRTSTGKPTV